MVKRITANEQATLHAALMQAQALTGAHLALVVRPRAASYRDYALFYGLIAGSILALALWWCSLLANFALLIAVQLSVVIACDLLAHRLTALVPRRVKHHHAAAAARVAFAELSARHTGPFVLLYVALAERYVHVFTDRDVHAQLPGDWHRVTDTFAPAMRRDGLTAACKGALDMIASRLSEPFPPAKS